MTILLLYTSKQPLVNFPGIYEPIYFILVANLYEAMESGILYEVMHSDLNVMVYFLRQL